MVFFFGHENDSGGAYHQGLERKSSSFICSNEGYTG